MRNDIAVIFDMDGVIFDTERLYFELWRPIAERYQIPDIEGTLYRCIGVNSEVTRRIFSERYGEDFPMEEYQKQIRKSFRERVEQGTMPVKAGVRSLLDFLREQGVPTAIASSTCVKTVREELASVGLLEYFRELVGGDMVAESKPKPDIFLTAAEHIGFAPEACVAIEDSYNGVRAAKAANMTAIMVPDLLEPDDEMRELADEILPSLREVERMFRETSR